MSSGETRGRNAYRAILDAIRDGIYRPGDRLGEEEVAQRLGVSRTPVREAFGRLREKGVLQAAAGRGLAIAVLDAEQVFELYAVRGEFEGLVARFASQHATEAEILNFRRLNEEFAAATSPEQAARLNRQFHARLYDAARNRYLRDAVDNLHETVALLPVTTFTQDRRLAAAAGEHERIVAAIAARDAEAAAEAARAHISQALSVRLQLIDSSTRRT